MPHAAAGSRLALACHPSTNWATLTNSVCDDHLSHHRGDDGEDGEACSGPGGKRRHVSADSAGRENASSSPWRQICAINP